MQGLKPPPFKQAKNEEAVTKYAAFLCGLILCVTAARWLRKLCVKSSHFKTSVALSASGRKACLLIFRNLQDRAPWKWLGRPSVELIIMVGVYLVGNIVFCSTILAMPQLLNHWASRFGWMGAANMVLCVFFGLKNTPLGPLAAVSYSQLNIFHRIVGYTAVFLVFLHAVVYTVHFGARQGRWVQLIKKENIEGMGAGIAMLILLMGYYRHRHYEVFYLSHIVGFLATVFLTALHRPNWAKKLPQIMIFIFSMWMLDRLIRFTRMSWNFINNSATFYPLPDGGTRLILKKPGDKDVLPGSHCFLWIPRLRAYENHPFTIVSNGTSGLEIVMKSHRGFTNAVGRFATRNPRSTLWASMDGPYGLLPNMEDYDKLVLVAGGSGAAFTFGVMNRIMMQPETLTFQSIDFLWAVKRIEHLSWFQHHLHSLTRARFTLNLTIYVTDEQPGSRLGVTNYTANEPQQFQEEVENGPLLREDVSNYETISEMGDMGGVVPGATNDLGQIPNLRFEKLDITTEISRALDTSRRHQSVLLMSCGPTSLMDAVEELANKWQSKRGVIIDVHREGFSD
ncbi:Ferric reductase transmembrane component 5 [Fusarium albosuccineum]|uniref:Ferric reductase transmembrane component 5 n=1 Tax=Fusarium albosuccineum TaxID=1237068 RepID=A0A8H4L797_9HYPO|nr:Ferric reductase transmembrane component 5 [Fusarium albosuccineum]